MKEGMPMTEKQFWMKLDQCAGKKNNLMDAAKLVRQAYEDDLGIICGVRRAGIDIYNQLYINLNEKEPDRENNRYMLCYSNREMGKADHLLQEPCEKLPVRFVIDNALNKPVIGGLIINRHSKDKSIVIPKQFLGDPAMVFEAIKNVFSNPDNPFNSPWDEEQKQEIQKLRKANKK